MKRIVAVFAVVLTSVSALLGPAAPTGQEVVGWHETCGGRLEVRAASGGVNDVICYVESTAPPLTPAPTSTPVPLPAPTPSASDSGFHGPLIGASLSGGDNNGFEASAHLAHQDGEGAAVDVNSGTFAGTTCTGSGKDRGQFYQYELALPANVEVRGLVVRLDAWADALAGDPFLCLGVSHDNGATWSTYRRTGTLTTSEKTYQLGGPTDTWGHPWTLAEAANLRVRLVTVASDNNRDFYLDWIAVRVHYAHRPAPVLGVGGHPLLDDYLIDQRIGVVRQINSPARLLSQPILPSVRLGGDVANFAVAVTRDSIYRLWYTGFDNPANPTQRTTSYLESADGLNWTPPGQPLAGMFDAELTGVLDRGSGGDRFQTILPDKTSPPPRRMGDLYTSPDGLAWTRVGTAQPVPSGEVWELFWDAARNRYGLLHRFNTPLSWVDQEGVTHANALHDPSLVRLFAYTASPTTNFPPSKIIFQPDARDSGETQFYSTSNVVQRGVYLVTMLSISRDDLQAPGLPNTVIAFGLERPVYGTGYTVLAWSTDGENWQRDREPFFSPAPDPDAFDHAITWIDAIVPAGDSLRLYYGGYQYGHKIFDDRSVGVAGLVRDRYVAQVATEVPGLLRTVPLRLGGQGLSLNADAQGGRIEVRVLDASGVPLAGFGPGECAPVLGNSTDLVVTCAGAWASLAGQLVRLEFQMDEARLYALNVMP